MPFLSPDAQRLTERVLALEAALAQRGHTLASLHERLDALGGWRAVRRRAAAHAQHALHVAAAAAARRATLAAAASKAKEEEVEEEDEEEERGAAAADRAVACAFSQFAAAAVKTPEVAPSLAAAEAAAEAAATAAAGADAVWSTIRGYLATEGHAKALAVFRAVDRSRSGKVGGRLNI
jgi:hypothetical protein